MMAITKTWGELVVGDQVIDGKASRTVALVEHHPDGYPPDYTQIKFQDSGGRANPDSVPVTVAG